ncbi:MAG TPA: hypothetical protein DDW50_07995 [Firmicutes bacterium]|nr:hypothetical protein [Bacillota bacterium]
MIGGNHLNLERLVSFFSGYLQLLVRGAHLEKFLNLLTSSGLYLWDVKRLGVEVMQIKVRAHAFLRIRRVARQTHTTVKIYQKKGWPFIRRKLVRRKIFWIGAISLIVFLVYLSSFVFIIKVNGFEDGERQQLLINLSRLGLKPGAPRRQLMQRKSLIEREVMIHTPGAVWLGITIRGIVAEVQVVKRKNAPKAVDSCDIVAAKDGVITKMVVIRGVPAVKEGDIVARGDLLISGVEWLTNPETGELEKREVAASGIVTAKVWYDLETVEPKIVWYPEVNQDFFREYRLRWGHKLLPLISFGRRPLHNYYWSRWRRPLYQGRNPFDSVEIIKDTWQKVIWHRKVRSRQEIERSVKNNLGEKLKKLDITVAPSTQVSTQEGNCIRYMTTYEKMEDIAKVLFSRN